MDNKLIIALLCALALASGCSGSSGVAVDSANPSTEGEVTDSSIGDEVIDSSIENGVTDDSSMDEIDDSSREDEVTDSPSDDEVTVSSSNDEIDDGSSEEDVTGSSGNDGVETVAPDDPGGSDGSASTDSGFPLDAPVIIDSLPAPVSLSSFRYSATAGELFWKAPSGTNPDTLYRVERDGSVLGTVNDLSFFTDALTPAFAHAMSVYVVDGLGHRSQAATTTFNDQVDVPPPVYEFELALDKSRIALEEGDVPGATIVINVTPQGDEPVELTIQGQRPDDSDNIEMSLAKPVLSREDSHTRLTFRMSVGMRPILEQERRFNLVATSGEQVRSAEIILDVTPISSPDVYLLIGQSNMVGSSKTDAKEIFAGGRDERNGRIWQLNVAPNNNRIFSDVESFVDEASNVIEPRYIEAEDPLHDPRNAVVEFKGGTTVGLGLSFAKVALADTTQRIYLVPAAWGASGFCKVTDELLAWNAGSSDNSALGGSGLLERALTRLTMTLRDTGGVLRGILWHQGGADSNKQACADAYAQNLQLMVERIRRDAPQDGRGPDARGSQASIPFIVATQSKGHDDRGDYSRWSATKLRVDSVHRNISEILPYSDWVNNDDLLPPSYPCGSSSCVHFGATANRETGRRFYEALTRIYNR